MKKHYGLQVRTYACVVATDRGSVYHITVDVQKLLVTAALISTAHSAPIRQIAFPAHFSEVFASCSAEQIRVWHAPTCRELLRIQVPNLVCHCLAFSASGREILTGWSDGVVRVFGPQSGKLLFSINNAHHQAVTAIAGTAQCFSFQN